MRCSDDEVTQEESEMDPAANISPEMQLQLMKLFGKAGIPDTQVRADGDSNSKTETPLLTAPSDEPLGSTLGVVWVSCDSEGVGMGVDRGDRVNPPGYVCVGGLDANDLDEAEDYVDGGMSSGYVDDRTGLMLDETLTKQAEAEEMDFMKKIQLYDVVESAEC